MKELLIIFGLSICYGLIIISLTWGPEILLSIMRRLESPEEKEVMDKFYAAFPDPRDQREAYEMLKEEFKDE